jgi:hypothetical protein
MQIPPDYTLDQLDAFVIGYEQGGADVIEGLPPGPAMDPVRLDAQHTADMMVDYTRRAIAKRREEAPATAMPRTRDVYCPHHKGYVTVEVTAKVAPCPACNLPIQIRL